MFNVSANFRQPPKLKRNEDKAQTDNLKQLAVQVPTNTGNPSDSKVTNIFGGQFVLRLSTFKIL
jgi:hypothetical protein